MRPPPHEQASGADERSPIRRPADAPAADGEALVEHLADRAARAEAELRRARASAAALERERTLLSRLARHVAERPHEPLRELARLCLPVLGHWCVVDELDRGEATRSAVVAHAELAPAAAELEGPLATSGESAIGLARVLHGGGAEALASLPEVSDDLSLDDEPTRRALQALATGPLLVVPVLARDRLVGALTFGRGRGEPEYDESAQRLAFDIASFVAVVLEQRRAEAAAAGAAQAKAQFLTMMSHELRTPLNAIAGYAQLLEMGFRGPLNEGQKEAVARILRGQEHLLELVDAVLTFSRVTSGRGVVETSPVSAAALLHEASEPFVAQFSAQGIAFSVAGCDAATLVSANADRTVEVLRHLLGNALKFTRRGGRVSLGCEVGGGVVRFVVADTGRGIAREQRESIFQPFVQVEKGLTRSVDGSGLGLAVGRELAERMGGTLTVTSEVGVGSRFVLALPRLARDSGSHSIDSLLAPG